MTQAGQLFLLLLFICGWISPCVDARVKISNGDHSSFIRIYTRKILRSSIAAIPLLLVQSDMLYPMRGISNRVLADESAVVDINCVKNVLRVKSSLKYIQSDIENVADMTKVINDIKSLQRNYRLEENIAKSVNLASSNQHKQEAKKHGLQAVEDISLIYEYFAGDVDDLTGKIKSTPKVLSFALDATKAAEKELGLLTDELPSNIFTEANEAVKEEFASYSSSASTSN